MRQMDVFSSAVILTRLELFEPGTHTTLAFFGEMDGGGIAVLDGQLTGRQNHRQRFGLIVVRHVLNKAYIDRAPLESTVRTREGGRSLWLGNHAGHTPEGILEINIGNVAFNGAVIPPVEPTATLAARGMDMAYCNTPLETLLHAAQPAPVSATLSVQ